MQITLRKFPPTEDIFGLLSPHLFRDPYPTYHMLRYADPVHWCEPLNSWLISRYDDVVAMFQDPRLSNALRRAHGTQRLAEPLRERMAPIDEHLSTWLFNADGERHKRLRTAMVRALNRDRIVELRPKLKDIAAELTRELASETEIDFIDRFAQLVPLRLIMHLLAMPTQDLDTARTWVRHIGDFFQQGPSSLEVISAMATTVEEMSAYMSAQVQKWQDDPPDNMFGDLLRARQMDEFVSHDELIAHLAMLVFAGHASTTDMIGVQLLTLMRHPDHFALVRQNPDVLHRAVREMSRYDGPLLRHDRVAAEDIELHGRHIAAGQRVVLILAAANRDPDRFSRPDVLDFDRPDPFTTAFGRGPHSCLASRLAHDMAETGLRAFLARYPDVRPGTRPPTWKSHFNFRGLREFPVRLRA